MGGTRVIGLTGGIGSGKSLVAGLLRELGAPVVDADELARRVVEPGQPALAEIAREFGPAVIAADGTLDRKAVAAIVFSDETRRRRLNAITHPRIAALGQAEIAAHAARGAKVVIYEAALIVENGLHHMLDGLIVVSAPPEEQVRRALARDGGTEEAVRARLASQLPLADTLAVATHIVDNAGSIAETRAQVERLWREIDP